MHREYEGGLTECCLQAEIHYNHGHHRQRKQQGISHFRLDTPSGVLVSPSFPLSTCFSSADQDVFTHCLWNVCIAYS